MPLKGYKQTIEHKKNCGTAVSLGWKKRKGKKSQAQIKYWESLKGKSPSNIKDLPRYGREHHRWKGDKVGYFALHHWVIRNLGRAKQCELCGRESQLNNYGRNNIHWANKSHTYKREITDWISLCVKCHKHYDGYTGEN